MDEPHVAAGTTCVPPRRVRAGGKRFCTAQFHERQTKEKVLTSASHWSPFQEASQLHVEVAAVHTPFSEQSSSLLHELVVISTERRISIIVGSRPLRMEEGIH